LCLNNKLVINMKEVYKYTTEVDYIYNNIIPEVQDCEYYTNKGNLLIIVKDGTVIIKKGYSWDGCTPKIKVFGKIIGTPDGVQHHILIGSS